MNEEQLYLNFEEYIRASEPHKRERAEAWRVAIGLHTILHNFFRNLLMGENHELKNRYMLVNAPQSGRMRQVPNK